MKIKNITNEKINRKKELKILLILYVLAVGVRFMLALLTRQMATMNIDEFLYTGLARSIGMGDGLLFRGQRANYNSIVYPCILAPVYRLFPSGSNYYRILQLWSIMVMQTSIFPIYGFCTCLLERRDEKALKLTALMMLLPDFCFGEILMSECVIYPLFFTAAYLGIRHSKEPKAVTALLLGVCAALLYATKPGQIALPVTLLAGSAALLFAKKQPKQAALALLGMAVIPLVIFGIYAIGGIKPGLAIYEEQVRTHGGHWDRFFRGLFLSAACFILASGVCCFVLPLKNYSRATAELKCLTVIIYIALGVTIIGTAWTINSYEYASDTIHLRYFAMYLPLTALLSVRYCEYDDIKTSRLLPIILMVFLVVCGIAYGFATYTAKGGGLEGTMSAAFLGNTEKSVAKNVIMTISAIVISAVLLYFVYYKKSKPIHLAITAFTVIMLINNFIVYSKLAKDPGNTLNIKEEGTRSLENIGESEYVYVSSDFLNIAYSTLSVNSRQNASFADTDDFFNATYESKGIYQPFVPKTAIRGTVGGSNTVDTDVLIFDSYVNKLIKMNEESCEHLSSPDVKQLFAYRITKGERYIDSFLGNVENSVLEKGLPGVLVIYDEEVINKPAMLRIQISAPEDTNITVLSGISHETTEIVKGTQWYEIRLDALQEAYNIYSYETDIKILDYEIVPEL